MSLRTDYVDDVIDTSENTSRKYDVTENADGSISLTDVTVYTQNGDCFGASDINETNDAVNVLSAGRNAGSNKTTVFNSDGSITETWTDDSYYKTTVFNSDGSITETMYDSSDVSQWGKTTVFNSDGSITETVTE